MLIKPNRYDVDFVGANLARLAQMARDMPPAFAGAGIKEPVYSQGGGLLGQVLDGRGLYLDCDLKDLGITKRIPHVYERSLTQRIIDAVGGGDDQGTINSYDAIINARANGQADDVMVTKNSYTTVANVWSTTFRVAGLPIAGTYSNIPGGAAPTNTNVGALSLGLTNPGGGNSKYLLTFGSVSAQQLNMIMLVDLLVDAGNISATSLAAQTVSSTALTRYTTGAGVYMTFDVTTLLGGTAANLTVSYTNQAGAAGQSTGAQAMTQNAIVQRLQPAGQNVQMVLASGDYGVQAVASATFSASMLAGVIALNLYKPLLWMPGIVANLYSECDTTIRLDGLVQLATTAGSALGCLTTYILTNTTTSGLTTMAIRTCAG